MKDGRFSLKQHISIHNLGPIFDFECDINDFTVFTGPQSCGKSTIAKAIFFFKTVKQDILGYMQQGGPKMIYGDPKTTWNYLINQRFRTKFMELFGTSWIMPADMNMKYTYSDNVWIRIFLTDGYESEKNYISFEFCQEIKDYLSDLDSFSFLNATKGQLESHKQKLTKLFSDDYETVFIPAGRNLITLLSSQLNYIFTSLEGSQLRNLDYVTKRYTELILKLKPMFSLGLSDILDHAKTDPETSKSLKSNAPAIRKLIEKADCVLRGTYRYVDGEERLYLDNSKYVKINFSSSGQQEIVWVFNLLFYYLLENKKVFLIIEEPESHLFPDSQQSIGELLSLFCNRGNQVLVTTHSPYILGTFNYLLYAGQLETTNQNALKKIVDKNYWLKGQDTSAYFISNGSMSTAIDEESELRLIKSKFRSFENRNSRISKIKR
ncbi:MAG: AAA family ATPase [Candidatus Limivicinus sp.]